MIVQIILGMVYPFSVFIKPLELEFGWARSTTQWAFSFALATFAVARIPVGWLQDRIGPRIVATIGGSFALFPSATADYFGSKHFGVNYGWIFTAYGVAGILGPVVGSVLFDVTQQYILAFVFAGTLCFLAARSAVVVWRLARAQGTSG